MGNRKGFSATLILMIVGLMAPAAGAVSADCNGTYAVPMEALLLNPNAGVGPSTATFTLPEPIPAGDYQVTLISHDPHSQKMGRPGQELQIREQWTIRLFDASGTVAFSAGPTPDLPDADDYISTTFTGSVTAPAVTVRVDHAALGDNVNSIYADCAVFEPIVPADGSIGDRVWLDANGDGLQQDSEAGLSGVTVTLTGNGVTVTTSTAGDGSYLFDGLSAGDYVAAVESLAGYEFTTPAKYGIVLGAGDEYLTADFGFAAPVTATAIGGVVFLDGDRDGTRDGGETGLEGISVSLSDFAGSTTTTTDGNGEFWFEDLLPGAYSVTVGSGPAGMILTTAGGAQIDLVAGSVDDTTAFGFALPSQSPALGSIGDFVWLDANENGAFDTGEAGLSGVSVILTGGGLGGPVVATTDQSGHYLFDDLGAGAYNVTVDASSGPINSRLTTPGEHSVNLSAGAQHLTADFGFVSGEVAASGLVGDFAFLDSNLNGLHDAGESGISGVRVSLLNVGTGEVTEAITNSTGGYLFAALAAGGYEVAVDVSSAPAGTGLTTANKYTIALGDGESISSADFGFAPQLPATGLETADFGIAGIVLLLIGAATVVLVRPQQASWHLVDAYEVR